MPVAFAVDIESRTVLGACIVSDKGNGEIPVVLCTWVLYEYVSGCTYKYQ